MSGKLIVIESTLAPSKKLIRKLRRELPQYAHRIKFVREIETPLERYAHNLYNSVDPLLEPREKFAVALTANYSKQSKLLDHTWSDDIVICHGNTVPLRGDVTRSGSYEHFCDTLQTRTLARFYVYGALQRNGTSTTISHVSYISTTGDRVVYT